MNETMIPEGGLDYDTAKRLARFGEMEERRHLAARHDTPPEILFFLAADTAELVRRELANNGATPGKADLVLARDSDHEVRSTLARKVVTRVPGNTVLDPGQLERLTLDVLSTLSRDNSTDVRKILSEALNDLKHAPKDVIKTLARDRELAVAGPVLRRSPTLNDDDLLEVVNAGVAGTAGAIAGRANVSPRIADAIAGTNDVQAIATLLANDSAQIREETLDSLLDRAPSHEAWHDPLVRRPSLHGGAVRKLSRFVALSLVEVLRARPDLDEEAAQEVAGVLHSRLKSDPDGEGSAGGPRGRTEDDRARARRLAEGRQLSEEMLDEAIIDNRREFVESGLSVMTGIDEEIVAHILQSRSARGVVALVWKAGYTMRLAMKIQFQLARIPPQSVIKPKQDWSFPMTREEMVWQLQFFGAA